MRPVSAQDNTLLTIASFVVAQRRHTLSETEFFDSRRRLLDTLGCGLAAFHEPPCAQARHLALQVDSGNSSSLLGTQERTSVALAAFANGWMMRYLDGAQSAVLLQPPHGERLLDRPFASLDVIDKGGLKEIVLTEAEMSDR